MTMPAVRCSESGHRTPIATVASGGPGAMGLGRCRYASNIDEKQ